MRIAYVSTYPPRECGIATFTKDLIDSIDKFNKLTSAVAAINEKGAIYHYDNRVRWVIRRDFEKDYLEVANKINSSNVELVNLQHEFGLFGGEWGELIKTFMSEIKKPVVTTLHTVQPDFSTKAVDILKSVTSKSAATVVITHSAANIMKAQGIVPTKCVVIPHGCPDIEFVETDTAKETLNLKNRLVISTFGLISRGKGIEYAIRALPAIVKKKPSLIYLIIGQTHPEVLKSEGEEYRNKLLNLVFELGLEHNVSFHNRYLTKRELIKYLQATDIYITPYVSPNQISSGTLTYALGAGKAIISTPYLHAQELLADGRGIFCKFNDSTSITDGLNQLLDEEKRKAIQKRAYKYGRRFIWKNVARKYLTLFHSIINKEI
jgi:glycosyltransferase involved in cell wall biosynthesis